MQQLVPRDFLPALQKPFGAGPQGALAVASQT
jgi:hypothetical protein